MMQPCQCAFSYQKLQQNVREYENYLSQIAEREVESSSGRRVAASVVEVVIPERASVIDAPAPLSTSPESPILGFWATWSGGRSAPLALLQPLKMPRTRRHKAGQQWDRPAALEVGDRPPWLAPLDLVPLRAWQGRVEAQRRAGRTATGAGRAVTRAREQQ